MAVGISEPDLLAPVDGVRVATVEAGVRYKNRRDLVLFELAEESSVAAVFTRNLFCAAPVTLAKEHLNQGTPRYLLINTGCANAGTGSHGMPDALACCHAVAREAKVADTDVLPFSTGVIGERLPVEPIVNAVPALLAGLTEDGWREAAHGIMTTDTVAKGVTQEVMLADGTICRFTGISKGSGMICPNMATMLAFMATDAPIAQPLLTTLLQHAVARSFNRVTVDGDTSTNDAALLVATGRARDALIEESSSDFIVIKEAITQLCQRLAQAIVRDGEGATKFVSVNVSGAATEAEAEEVAYTIAHSPLIKTALFASDPNWGRILAAIGRARVPGLTLDNVSLSLGDVRLICANELDPNYTEARGKAVMAEPEIDINVDLGRGEQSATVWTCDLSYDYVRINADYRS